MGEVEKNYQDKELDQRRNECINEQNRWVILKNIYNGDSRSSNTIMSSSEMNDDASSSLRSSSSSLYGPLYELSELMAQLPIKRGISKHYQGKSESFGCLASVKILEDLPKKDYSFRKRIKACKLSPKATISKKKTTSRPSSLCFVTTSSILTNY